MSLLGMKANQSEVTMADSELHIKPVNSVKCVQNKQALNICSNKLCEKYAFVCSDKLCSCRQDHSQCLKAQIESLLTAIRLKYNPKIIEQKIESIFSQISSEIQIFKQKIFQKLNQSVRQSQFLEKEQLFIDCIQSESYKKISGSMVWEVQVELFKRNQNNNQVQNVLKTLDHQYAAFDPFLRQLFVSIQKCLTQLHSNEIQQQPFSNSKLIIHPEDISFMSKLLDSKIKSTTLLYRASQHQFSVDKFYERCSNVPHTLAICETHYKKIIGGYTSLCWFRTQKCQQVPDDSETTFLFSLTNKDKFTLKNRKYAINRSSSTGYGPAFGNGWDLFIRDKANLNINSGGRINCSFVNQNYKEENKESKFLGTSKESINCRLKEWEVWQIEFQ